MTAWDKLNILTEGEMDKYLVAVRAVNGNPYYGFNRDLGAAKSTLFSSVAYVAKELLIKIAGEMSLTKYQGWVRKPKNPPAIERLIEQYTETTQERMAIIIDGPVNGNVLAQYNDVINAAVHDNMFS